jgi:hypothetical protein
MARRREQAQRSPAMNNIKRWVFGFVSSLLLAAGFVRAAGSIDPVSAELSVNTDQNVVGAPECGSVCNAVIDEQN